MRTLKKTLCLVLALVMMLGVCAFNVAAADFSDGEAITYKEATGVMRATKVLEGYPDGSFKPEETLNRAQAAKMIACMLGFGDLKGSSNFTDCKEHWADSYIAFCSMEGIIVGYGNGTFGPEDTLKGYDWAKMLICALGYNAAAENIAGDSYQIAVARKIKDLKLDKNIAGFDGTKPISRQQASELGFQAMQAAPVKYKPGITVNGVAIPGEYDAAYTGSTMLEKMGIYKKADADSDAFGRPGLATWVKAADQAAADLIDTKTDSTKLVYASPADALLKVNAALVTTKTANAWDVSEAKFYKNGDTDGENYDATEIAKLAGAQVEYYASVTNGKVDVKDGKTVVKKVIVTDYTKAVVTAVNATTKAVKVKVGSNEVEITAPDTGAKASDNYTAVKDFVKDDVLAICVNGSVTATGKEIMAAVKAGTVAGKVTAANTAKKTVTVSGTTYSQAATMVDEDALKLGAEGTLYLSPYGSVIGFAVTKAAETAAEYVYVVGSYSKPVYGSYGSSDPNYIAVAVNMNGEIVEYPVCAALDDEIGKLMKLSTDIAANTKDNKVDDAHKTHSGKYAFVADDAALVTDYKAAVEKGAVKIDGTYFTNDVKFIYISGVTESDGDIITGKLNVTVKSGAQEVGAKTTGKTPVDIVKQYAKKTVGSNTTTSAVFVVAEYEAPVVTTSGIAYVSTALSAASTETVLGVTDANGKGADEAAYLKTVYIDGVKTDIKVKSEINEEVATGGAGFYKVLEDGQFTKLVKIDAEEIGTGKKYATLVSSTEGATYFAPYLNYASTDKTVAADAVVIDLVDRTVEGNKTLEAITKDNLAKYTTTVALVLSADGKTINTIYVTAAAAIPESK